jgi:hypothetical protein
MRSTVAVKGTNGFGNNLFQYCYARLVAESQGCDLYMFFKPKARYAIKVFGELGINLKVGKPFQCKPIIITDQNASSEFYGPAFKGKSFRLDGHFENYRLYEKHFNLIKTWFPVIETHNKKDLVFHLRMGDRLFLKSTYISEHQIKPEQYLSAIEKFDFARLHIVTDMPSWEPLTLDSLSKMKFHAGGTGGKKISQGRRIQDDTVAVDYFNEIYDALRNLNPAVRCSYSIADDFNYIRSFDKILIQSGTLSWWAACLSNASKVGAYGPWRPYREADNSHLSDVKLPGWFTWE